jgi:hypothetical protein
MEIHNMRATKHSNPRSHPKQVFSAILILAALAAPSASAVEPTYLGRWKIVSATVAPWAKDGPAPDGRMAKSLLDSIVTLAPKFVSGPGSFPCSAPRYEVIEGPAEILFQGMFGAMREKDPKVEPQKLAEEAGLKGTKFRTVLTGCEFAVDFSQGADPDVAAFALDNYVYLMKRE